MIIIWRVHLIMKIDNRGFTHAALSHKLSQKCQKCTNFSAPVILDASD